MLCYAMRTLTRYQVRVCCFRTFFATLRCGGNGPEHTIFTQKRELHVGLWRPQLVSLRSLEDHSARRAPCTPRCFSRSHLHWCSSTPPTGGNAVSRHVQLHARSSHGMAAAPPCGHPCKVFRQTMPSGMREPADTRWLCSSRYSPMNGNWESCSAASSASSFPGRNHTELRPITTMGTTGRQPAACW